MAAKPEKGATPTYLVDVSSSDDENVVVRVPATNSSSGDQSKGRSSAVTLQPSASNLQSLECRSFWKAGDYAVAPAARPPTLQGHLEHARVHPKFLHSNATSHKWAFGAIAELLDNAVDEINNGATFVKLDKIDIMKDNSPALLFQDDGGGMNPDAIRKCMSLGYSSKKSGSTIGQYGNGFKTSTMRLGADAIVLSRANRYGHATQSVGLLSYTFLRKTGQDDVIVPMIDFDVSGNLAEPIVYTSQDDWSSNLDTILEWSPFESKEDLILQFEDIGAHGTKVIVYNLWLNDEGIYELNFDDDDEDIRLRDEGHRGVTAKLNKKVIEYQSHISYRLRYSLREYASILYRRKFTNFSIILRGVPVKQYNIAEDFLHKKVISYRPQLSGTSKEVTAEASIGFVKEAPNINVTGFNVYHKNRLIRPFWKVTADGSSKGSGVVGVIEANFIEPAHDKQDFERSSLYIRLEQKLKHMILEYWKDHCELMGYQTPKSKARKEGYLQSSSGQMNKPGSNLPFKHQGVAIGAEHADDFHEQPIDSLPADTTHDLSNIQRESVEQETATDDGGSLSIDQLCEANIQLFMRCEEYVKKEDELKQTIETMEKELADINAKRAELSLLVRKRKKEGGTALAEKV